MSRIAKKPIFIPDNVYIKLKSNKIFIKGTYGSLEHIISKFVTVKYEKNLLTFCGNSNYYRSWMHAGTCRSLVNSMIYGVQNKFFKTLLLSGVGYRVSLNKNILSLYLGFSHKIEHCLPDGVDAVCDSLTKIVLSGINKQLVFQAAANLRAYRSPEPYKGKGICYKDETVIRKETKKK
ncbi:50S ribosomal protein L6 [Buchnera aphidicola (Chaitoregma tattakana)]|uniref:50S ribosomal protein L6 n=1 Tax=Buchnera aphidicola TaxID=9 RepID=UPI0031B84D54